MTRRAVVLLAILLVACDGPGSPIDPEEGAPGGGLLGGVPIDQTATFTRVQNEVFTPTCATLACHDPLGQQSGMVLIAGRSFADVVNVRSVENPALSRIAPNDPANSYLYRKITGAGSPAIACHCCNRRCPKPDRTGSQLDPARRA